MTTLADTRATFRRCHYCGAPADTVDHVIPRHYGGTDEPDNLVDACRSCNSAKGSLPIEVFKLSNRDRSRWLADRGWTRLGANSWTSPDTADRAFYTKAAALRHEGFVRSGISVVVSTRTQPPVGKLPAPLPKGLRLDEAYALGLSDGSCPIGLVIDGNEDGVVIRLLSWLTGMFALRDEWVSAETIVRWRRAERIDETHFEVQPLGDFQTAWCEEQR